jgi:hypothetical protein
MKDLYRENELCCIHYVAGQVDGMKIEQGKREKCGESSLLQGPEATNQLCRLNREDNRVFGK